MKKKYFIPLAVLLVLSLVGAAFYPEPFVTNLDINNYNISDADWISANYFNGTLTGEVTGSMNWTYLQNYPAVCAGSSAITQLNDSVTCSDLWVDVAGDNMTGNLGMGTNNITNFTEASGTLLDVTNLEADNLESNLDGTGYNITSSWFFGNLNWSYIQNRFITAVDNVYIYMSGTTATLNETKLNNSIDARSGILNVNSSDYWDDMGSINASQMEDDGGVLHILDSWITAGWCVLTGCTIDGDLNVTGDLDVTGNVTAENVHLPSYLFTHTNVTMAVGSAGVWYNVTFDTHEDSENERITHNYSGSDNDTFTIVDTGEYMFSYGISYIDSDSSPLAHVAIRLLNNGTEVEGSVFEKDTTKQNVVGTLYRNAMASLSAGDEIKLQFISNETTVSMYTEGTYGDHPTSANINIHRIA